MVDSNELIKKIRHGDSIAFEKLYRETQGTINHYVTHFIKKKGDAENIIKDVYVSLWEMRSNLSDELPLKDLLYTLTKDKVLNFLRKEVNKTFYIGSLRNTFSAVEAFAKKSINDSELEKIISDSLMELPDRKKTIFLQSINDGLSYSTIAQKFNISETSVTSQIRNILDLFQKVLQDKIR